MGAINYVAKPKKDLTGQKFNDLTALNWEFCESRHCNLWKCVCECGEFTFKSSYELTSGKAKTCGKCKAFELKSKCKLEDLTGKRFGRLTVLAKVEEIYRNPSGISQVRYWCQCDCGNIIIVFAGNLRKGNTLSCGCYNRECSSKRELRDLTGMRFGLLTVIKRAENYVSSAGNMATQWLCICDCGKETIVASQSLLLGKTRSCGHIKNSMGETIIREYLKLNSIPFETEYSFNDLLTEKGNPMRFDFAIFNNNKELNFLIEYQGPQHYYEYYYSGKNFGKQQREETDPAKRKYCNRNNILLYEIRFDEDIYERLNYIFMQHNYVNSVPSSEKEKV